MNDNVSAFLEMIAVCEGTAQSGYRSLFGGGLFDGYVTHPNRRIPFTEKTGALNFSTAAGRYQELYGTFMRLQKKLRTVDFTPQTQDEHAMELISEAGAMGDVKDGNIVDAINKTGRIWASLPSSEYPQAKRTLEFALKAYLDAGGILT